MRFLWVEDFNDKGVGIDTEEELKNRLIDFFDLREDKVIIQKTLSSAIKYLENKDNLDSIDSVLVDIRFPEGNTTDNLYLNYLSNIVTLEFYENNIDDASGILLYLLLVFRYHVSQDKIAFVSANVSSDNSKIKTIQKMAEIIAKSKYMNLSDEDEISYRTSESKLRKIVKDKTWDTFISKEGQVENVDIDKLLQQIYSLPILHNSDFQVNNSMSIENGINTAQSKYNAVKDQFDTIGFAMPFAFEKPNMGEKSDKRYSFINWKDSLYNIKYNAVRSNVQEMCNVLIEYLGSDVSDGNFYASFLELMKPQERKYYDATFYIAYLRRIRGLFTFNCDESELLRERVVREVTALWEVTVKAEYNIKDAQIGFNSPNPPFYNHDDNCYYAVHATMRLTRNWCSHQGLKKIDIIDVGLIFLLTMRGLFEIDVLPNKYLNEYKEYEEHILNQYDVEDGVKEEIDESLRYFIKLNNKVMGKEYPSKKIFDKISGLGNENSKIRREVSMDEVYMLLYHILDNGCNGIYKTIKDRIKTRTWKEWKKRYNSRFKSYVCRDW